MILLILALLCSCSTNLDIERGSDFTLTALPYHSTISKGETCEIDIEITAETTYQDINYTIRQIQNQGTGTITMDDGRILQENRTYILSSRTFTIRYTAASDPPHSFIITVADNLGHSHNLTISFT